MTDHKPLVSLFSDRMLDQIANSRLFSLKQRTIPWRFTVEYKPGKDNCFSDATSRNPVNSDDDDGDFSEITNTEILCGIMMYEPDEAATDIFLAGVSSDDDKLIRAITWDLVKHESGNDKNMQNLISLINSTFPEERNEMPHELLPYWSLRNNLYVVDGVVLTKDQVLIPPPLRNEVSQSYIPGANVRIIIPLGLRSEVVQSLHSAHQGVSSMNERAKASVYWPGITNDIESVRRNCQSCNKIMPSQARTLPVEPWIPTTPFEAIACDYFHFMGYYYFVAADRLSGWIEVQQIKVGTNEAGAEGLCKAVRRLMVTFGVPVEISSDGGPEFIAGETMAFFKRWGIRHRLSSVSFPSSNGRAELAVKTAKRLLMDNVSPTGKLDNDGMVRALLTYRNTPDPGCKLSPAQILLGHPLRDTLPYITKDIMVFNNPDIHPQWKEAWKAKEDALKARYMKTLETLSEHSRSLPPLRHGDHVLIQNQSGRFPKKWDKSGVIVETKPNDQYVVKVAGTGRLTLRNRRFLRKYSPHYKQGPEWQFAQPEESLTDTCTDVAFQNMRSSAQSTPQTNLIRNNVVSSPLHPTENHFSPSSGVIADEKVAELPEPFEEMPHSSDSTIGESPGVKCKPHRLSFGDFVPSPVSTESDAPLVQFTRPVRPTRMRKPRQFYDASTGTYTVPSTVTDDI